MAEDSEEWEFFLETLWNMQCLKEHSELSDELKKAFYVECQGITAVAVNLFILAQERVLFDEANIDEKITPQVLRQTAKIDMKIIQPMLNAIRKNNIKAMYKYEDIMINLDDLMINHKKGTEYEGRVKDAMKERLNTLNYKRRDMIENLSVEVSALGIFNALNVNDIRKLVTKTVEKQPIDIEYNLLKLLVIQQAMEMNQKLLQRVILKEKQVSNFPLLAIREKALAKKKHPYDYLKQSNFIRDPISELF